MAVVKTGTYGHGTDEICNHLNKMEVTAFAAATIEEGIKPGNCGIRGKILILGHTSIYRVSALKNMI